MTTQAEARAEPAPLELSDALRMEARTAIVNRLGELVCWPTSRIPPYERQLAADILVGLLRTSRADLRARVALGLAAIHDAPKALLRYLARDDINVSQPLIVDGIGFDDSDLIATVRAGVAAHWHAIARRKTLSEAVVDALVQTNETPVIETLLKNSGARFSAQAVDMAVARSRAAPALCAPLIARPELRPTQALVLFWWCGAEARHAILKRYPVDRSVLIESLGEVFALAAQEGWADAETRKALQLIERRQRNREAATRSVHGSLEGAALRAEAGLDTQLMNEIAHLAGVKPQTAVQIFSDPGGEPIAVLAKATGLKRNFVTSIWKGLRRPLGDADNPDTAYGRTMMAFEMLSTAKAQTVLRYWNWSFSADAAAGIQLLDDDIGDEIDFLPAQRNAALLLRR
ncbi:MAG: DUF2336 domain-containing protein [Hyphomonadaceae bacterium]